MVRTGARQNRRRWWATVLAATVVVAMPALPAFAGSGSGWTVASSPNPSTPQGTLAAVACPAPSSCLAVGFWVTPAATERPLAERWDGARWTDQAVPTPSGSPAATLGAVTCLSLAWCVATGTFTDGAGAHRTLVERWDGAAWTVQPSADPPAAATAELDGAYCLTTTNCMAVGTMRTPAGVPTTLAETWDGRAWAVQATPNPVSSHGSGLSAVSCAAATACIAAGTTNDQQAFAERWDGTSWALDAGATPAGADLSDLHGVSCVAPSTCIAVGSAISKKSGLYGPTPLAERWDGSAWTPLGAVNPAGATYGSDLAAVSCLSASACTAVGHTSATDGLPTLAEAWDGSAWTVQAMPTVETAGFPKLVGVSCAAANACTAVGSAERNTGVPQTLAERWDGRRWATSVTVDHAGAQVSSLRAVSCPSADRCMAVGTAGASTRTTGTYPSFAGAETALSEWFDGVAWHLVPVVNPPDGAGTTLYGVSCPSSTACIAVGYYDRGSTQLTLAERWDGHGWAVQRPADLPNMERASLRAVSCTSADSCTAVGTWTDWSGNDSTLAERWDGRSWTVQPTPNPPDSQSDTLAGVSCAASNACVAAGFYIGPDALGTRGYAVAEHWDGSAWAIQPVPDPVPAFGSTASDGFNGVSCTSPTSCIAVGSYDTFDRPLPAPTLAERWDGQAWTWQPTPNPATISDALETLSGISCASATDCRAVGFYYNGTGTNSGVHTIGQRWDGTNWMLDPSAEPAGALRAELTGVSCAASRCAAVGNFSYEEGSVSEDIWPGFTLAEIRAG